MCIQAQPRRYRERMVFGGGTCLSPDCWAWEACLRLSSLGTIRKQRDSERAWGLGSSCALSQFYKVLALKWLAFSSLNSSRIAGKTGVERLICDTSWERTWGEGVAARTSPLGPLAKRSPTLPRGGSNSCALNSYYARYFIFIFSFNPYRNGLLVCDILCPF